MDAILSDLGELVLRLIGVNVELTLTAIAIALPVACLFAFGRLSRFPMVYYPVTLYVNLLRSSPLLMIMFWAYYTGPMITGSPTTAYTAGVIALSAFEVAYFTELVRSGIQSIPASQRRAALATGLTPTQVALLIVLPQALRRMLPSVLSQSIIAFQDSTIASVIGVTDVFQTTNIISAREQRPIELYSTLVVLFFVICYALSGLARRLERRASLRIAGGAAPH